jgi:hypothetical protein
MNHNKNLGQANVKEPLGFHNFQALVYHGCGINGDFTTHIPVRMRQRICYRYMLQIIQALASERSAGSC